MVRQNHGFIFENWVKVTCAKKSKGYGYKWDIPKEWNPTAHDGPISVKSIKWGSSICLGDAIRQYDIYIDFTMIVGFWDKVDRKIKVIDIVEVPITNSTWRSLWGNISIDNLEELDKIIKDRDIHYEDVRTNAKQYKDQLSNSIITLNPKIDSKVQRRLQCSISFKNFFKYLVKQNPVKRNNIALWGEIYSPI